MKAVLRLRADSAGGGIRTRVPTKGQGPEPCAFDRSATPAITRNRLFYLKFFHENLFKKQKIIIFYCYSIIKIIRHKMKKITKAIITGLLAVSLGGLGSLFAHDWYNHRKKQDFVRDRPAITENYHLASLHMHTTLSIVSGRPDGEKTLEEVISGAFDNDYSIISVTEHDNEDPFQILSRSSQDKNLEDYIDIKAYDVEQINDYTVRITDLCKVDQNKLYLLRGVEFTTKENWHLLGIAYSEMPEPFAPIDEIINSLKEQDAIIIAPHPSHRASSGMGHENVKKYSGYFDALELNGCFPFPINYVFNGITERWSNELGIPVIANSDAHIRGTYFNNFLSLFPKQGFDEEDIKGYIRHHLSNGTHKNIEITDSSLALYNRFLLGNR